MIKQRIARPGQGRSGGHRNMIVYRSGDRAVFVFGFAKSDREDIEPDELVDLKTTATLLLGYDEAELDKAVDNQELWEVMCDDQEV